MFATGNYRRDAGTHYTATTGTYLTAITGILYSATAGTITPLSSGWSFARLHDDFWTLQHLEIIDNN
ncbi:MAG: hypothetical protein ACMV1C_05465 [Bacteroides graminisolvens]|jgi:hypothetical protein|uniref:hypothetical protein n=1 Tax=uncultured Bacteroides sp. TaxID=162156 RepID=UPI00280A620B|nr:hypothetical protein [uncultured Bacteroides sp.]HPW71411.1 hypothetical protein [Bacteroides graminisolvens]